MLSVSLSQYDRYELEILKVIKEGVQFVFSLKPEDFKILFVTLCRILSVTLNGVCVRTQALRLVSKKRTLECFSLTLAVGWGLIYLKDRTTSSSGHPLTFGKQAVTRMGNTKHNPLYLHKNKDTHRTGSGALSGSCSQHSAPPCTLLRQKTDLTMSCMR